MNNTTTTPTTTTTTTSSNPTENSQGQFNDRQVEAIPSSSPRSSLADVIKYVDLSDTNTLNSLGISRQDIAVEIQCESPKGLIEGYVDLYKRGKFNYTRYTPILLGQIISGSVKQLQDSIYQRLLKIGLACTDFPGFEGRILLPTIAHSKYEIGDSFLWFLRNSEVQTKFKLISNAFDIMRSLTEALCEKLERAEYNPVVSFLSKKVTAQKTQLYSAKDAPLLVQKTIYASEPDLQISRKDKDRGAVIKIGCMSNLDQKGRMKIKNEALTKANENVREHKEIALKCLKHFQTSWIDLNLFNPSKIQAYMVFETLLNHAHDVSSDIIKFGNNKYKDIVLNYLIRAFGVFSHVLDQLLPYANEITQAFDIDLSKDKGLEAIFDIKSKVMPRSMIDEFNEWQSIENELAERKRSKKASAKPITTTATTTTASKQAPKAKPIAQRKISQQEEAAMKKQLEINSQISAQKAKDLKAARDTAQKQRNAYSKGKDKQLQSRKAVQAQSIVDKHKQEELVLEEAQKNARLESQGKVHHLPSEDFIQGLISKFKQRNQSVFKMLFGELENNNTMNDTDILNLASYFKDRFIENQIGCAKDFYNYVLSRIHRRHDSDTGDLLPTHYVDILRTCFVIFGIFPKDWKPTTSEDFDAVQKLLSRRADAIYWQGKL